MKTYVQVLLWLHVSFLLGKSLAMGGLGCLEGWTVFPNDCTVLHPCQQWTRVPVTLYPHQHLACLVLIGAILMDVWERGLSSVALAAVLENAWFLMVCDGQT